MADPPSEPNTRQQEFQRMVGLLRQFGVTAESSLKSLENLARTNLEEALRLAADAVQVQLRDLTFLSDRAGAVVRAFRDEVGVSLSVEQMLAVCSYVDTRPPDADLGTIFLDTAERLGIEVPEQSEEAQQAEDRLRQAGGTTDPTEESGPGFGAGTQGSLDQRIQNFIQATGLASFEPLGDGRYVGTALDGSQAIYVDTGTAFVAEGLLDSDGGGGSGSLRPLGFDTFVNDQTGAFFRVNRETGIPELVGTFPELATTPNLQVEIDRNGNLIGIDPTGQAPPIVLQEGFGFAQIDPERSFTEQIRQFDEELGFNREKLATTESGLNKRALLGERGANFRTLAGLIPQFGELALAEGEFQRDVLSTPADAVARAFFQEGSTSPFPQVTQADLLNSMRGQLGSLQSQFAGLFPQGAQFGFSSSPTTAPPPQAAGAGFVPAQAPAPPPATPPVASPTPQPGFTSAQLQQLTQAGIGNVNDPRAQGFTFAGEGGEVDPKGFTVVGEPLPDGSANPEIITPDGQVIPLHKMNSMANGGQLPLVPGESGSDRLNKLDENAAQQGFSQENLEALAQAQGLVPGSPAYRQFINEVQAAIQLAQTVQGFPGQPTPTTGTGVAVQPGSIADQILNAATNTGNINQATIGGENLFTSGGTGGSLTNLLLGLPELDTSSLLARGFSNEVPLTTTSATTSTTPGAAGFGGGGSGAGASRGPWTQQQIIENARLVSPPSVNAIVSGGQVTPGIDLGFQAPSARNLARLNDDARDILGSRLAAEFNQTLGNVENETFRRFAPGFTTRTTANRIGF